ncbi:MAG: hypothetical protein IJT23_02650 [Clostridia bacterium]|nr:hypothetical protein [Clostridia bacterium]
MNESITVYSDDDSLNKSGEFILNIQKAMLVTLFEKEQINHSQYEYAVELLEKKFRKK